MKLKCFFIIFFLMGCSDSFRNNEEKFIRITSDRDSLHNMTVIYVSSIDKSRIFVKNYWDNGILQAASYFSNGQKEGEWFRYFDDGTVSFKGQFLNGKKDGEHLVYNMNGSIRIVEKYNKGDSIGIWQYYTPEDKK